MKKFFTSSSLALFILTAQPAHSTAFTDHRNTSSDGRDDKNKVISIGSNRSSGNMELRFTSGKEGEALITILDESGEIVSKQTSQLVASINLIPLKNVTGLSEGAYTVRLSTNNKIYTTSFLIWK